MIPARWRISIGKDLYISPASNGALLMLTESEFKALKDKVNALQAPAAEREGYLRYLDYNTQRTQVDGQGRVMLNERSLNRSEIRAGDTVVLTLRTLGFEVCSQKRWALTQERYKPAFERIGEQVGG